MLCGWDSNRDLMFRVQDRKLPPSNKRSLFAQL